jgi:hypoxanthine phosphoribosyltransferase
MTNNAHLLKHLSWNEFDLAVEAIAAQCPSVNGVYGVPRGGLVLAVALSHRLLVPLLSEPRIGALWVDDIVDTGRTVDNSLKGMTYAAWVNKRYDYEVISAQSCGDEWVVFPWEKSSNATSDKDLYDISRRTQNK